MADDIKKMLEELEEAEKKKKEKEEKTDIKLRFDAFMGNVNSGGLRSVGLIMLLVSYIVANMNGKVSEETIISATDDTMIANHFEVIDAITKLIKSGSIQKDENGMLFVKEQDIQAIELIEKDLPYTIREKAIKACQTVLARESYQRENKASIEKTENGYKVHLTVSDAENDFMVLDLFAASEEQSQIIVDKFLQNPVSVYDNLIESIFNN